MLEHQRQTLKENAEALANLLTENVPYLLSHYLQNGVLSEAERESIISASSAPAIRIKLVETLADKDGLSLDSVLDGLSATENHSVVAEINSLLAKGDNTVRIDDDGSGDKFEDVSSYATNLVDEVIAKAEETTSQIMLDKEKEEDQDDGVVLNDTVESENEKEEGTALQAVEQTLVKTDVEVHHSDPDEAKDEAVEEIIPVKQEEEVVKKELKVDVPDRDRSVSFSVVTTIIDDRKEEDDDDDNDNDTKEEEPSDAPSTPISPPLTPSEKYPRNGLDAQQSENEEDDNDNIDIEKEFVMPPEASQENGFNKSNNVTNGGPTLTRMASNDIILEEEGKKNDSEKESLDAILARKALVRQQVEKFEKTSPTPPTGGKIKYSFRTASQDKTEIKEEERGSNVKNLKNFFQQLSASSERKSPPTGAVKPVGKLKVTFPAH